MPRRWDFVGTGSAAPCPPASLAFQAQSGTGAVERPVGLLTDHGRADEVWAAKAGQDDLVKERQLRQRMAMEIAQAPAKGLPMQAIMMYMTGSGVSIISIMIVGMCLVNSVKALLATNQRFKKLDDGTINLLFPKLTYFAVNCLVLGVGLWKCGNMGLLPTTSADWLSYLADRPPLEYSCAPLSFR